MSVVRSRNDRSTLRLDEGGQESQGEGRGSSRFQKPWGDVEDVKCVPAWG